MGRRPTSPWGQQALAGHKHWDRLKKQETLGRRRQEQRAQVVAQRLRTHGKPHARGQFSAQQVSATGAARFASRLAPQRPLQAFFRELLELHFPAEHDYRILDAGAGPFTQVGHVWAGHQVELFATDAMASEFDRLFAAHPHMRRPAVHTQQCDFERLSQCLRPLVGQLHFVWTQNSLDHAYDPLAGIAGMLYLLRPRGLLGVLVFENEAKNEGYRGMHQWNFWRSQPNRKPRLLLGDRWGIVADIEQSFAQNATLLRSEIVRYWSDDDSSGMEPISELQLHQVSKRHRWLLILLQKKESTAVRADSRPLG